MYKISDMKKYKVIYNFSEFILESIDPMILELGDIENSSEFRKWLDILDDNSNKDRIINKHMLLNGYCEDLALYLHYKYGVEVFSLDKRPMVSGHYFVKYKGKYYDGSNREGVNKPSELDWSINYSNKYNIDVESLNDNLEPLDYIWNGYKEGANELFGIT